MAPLLRSTGGNRLIQALAPDERERILAVSDTVTHGLRQIVQEAGEPIGELLFIEKGLVSILAQTPHGRIEVGMIGPEGVLGVPLVLGIDRSPYVVLTQAECRAIRLPAAALPGLLREGPRLNATLLRYVHFLMIQTAQTAYSNASFGIEPRLARWILMTQDRLAEDDLPMTHEFLSLMLGARRPSVTTAIHILEGNGMIRARRGTITVRDRQKLEDLAGEAYGLSEAEYERLFGAER